MNFNISEDMKIVRELLKITQEELADELNVEPLTIKRIENGITNTSKRTLDLFYDFIYLKKIYLNKIKEMFYKEELIKEKLLFHGAKSTIIGNIDLNVLIPGGIGSLITLVCLSKGINFLLQQYYSVTFHSIIGIVIAATIMIIPFSSFLNSFRKENIS